MELEEMYQRMGRNIVLLRKYYGISRRSLAKLISVPEGRLRRVELGDPNARLYDVHLLRLARVFDVRINVLTDEELHR